MREHSRDLERSGVKSRGSNGQKDGTRRARASASASDDLEKVNGERDESERGEIEELASSTPPNEGGKKTKEKTRGKGLTKKVTGERDESERGEIEELASSTPPNEGGKKTKEKTRGKGLTIGERAAGATKDGDESDVNRAKDAYCLEFDGASRGNPGFAGAGALLKRKKDGRILEELTEYLGNDRTVNEAEYSALCLGLRKAIELGITTIECQGDSSLIVNQVNGLFAVKSDKLAPLHAEALRLKKKFSSFRIEHVRREYNKHADHLANMAVDFGLAPSKMTGFESGGGRLGAGTEDFDLFKRRKTDGDAFTPFGTRYIRAYFGGAPSTSASNRGVHTIARAQKSHDSSPVLEDRAMTTSVPLIVGTSGARTAWTSRARWIPVTRALLRLRL